MQIKQKKWVVVLLVIALVLSILSILSLVVAICISGDYAILSIICCTLSFLISFPILVYIISSKIALMSKEK